jgi:hypothetical protein
MLVFVGHLLGIADGDAPSPNEGENARALVAYVKSERLQLALHSDDFAASLETRPIAVGNVELEWLWHLVELSELRPKGLAVGGGNEEQTLKDLVVKFSEHGITAKRFRPSNLLPILVEVVKRLSNWEPDDSEQKVHVVLAICSMILPFQLLDLEDLGHTQCVRVFVLFLSMFLDPLASSKRLEVSKINLFNGVDSPARDFGTAVPATPPSAMSPFQVKKTVSASNISSQVAAQLKKKLDEKQIELEKLNLLHSKKLEQLKVCFFFFFLFLGAFVFLKKQLQNRRKMRSLANR